MGAFVQDFCADCGAILPDAKSQSHYTAGRHRVGIGSDKRLICTPCFCRSPRVPTHYHKQIQRATARMRAE